MTFGSHKQARGGIVGVKSLVTIQRGQYRFVTRQLKDLANDSPATTGIDNRSAVFAKVV
jgi:hypothetical protein